MDTVMPSAPSDDARLRAPVRARPARRAPAWMAPARQFDEREEEFARARARGELPAAGRAARRLVRAAGAPDRIAARRLGIRCGLACSQVARAERPLAPRLVGTRPWNETPPRRRRRARRRRHTSRARLRATTAVTPHDGGMTAHGREVTAHDAAAIARGAVPTAHRAESSAARGIADRDRRRLDAAPPGLDRETGRTAALPAQTAAHPPRIAARTTRRASRTRRTA